MIAASEQALPTGRSVTLDPVERHRRPDPAQAHLLSVPHKPSLVNAAEPQTG